MEASTEVAKAGKAGLNLLLWGGTLFLGAVIVGYGWNYARRKQEEKGKLV